jgi:hypothetical protein
MKMNINELKKRIDDINTKEEQLTSIYNQTEDFIYDHIGEENYMDFFNEFEIKYNWNMNKFTECAINYAYDYVSSFSEKLAEDFIWQHVGDDDLDSLLFLIHNLVEKYGNEDNIYAYCRNIIIDKLASLTCKEIEYIKKKFDEWNRLDEEIDTLKDKLEEDIILNEVEFAMDVNPFIEKNVNRNNALRIVISEYFDKESKDKAYALIESSKGISLKEMNNLLEKNGYNYIKFDEILKENEIKVDR